MAIRTRTELMTIASHSLPSSRAGRPLPTQLRTRTATFHRVYICYWAGELPHPTATTCPNRKILGIQFETNLYLLLFFLLVPLTLSGAIREHLCPGSRFGPPEVVATRQAQTSIPASGLAPQRHEQDNNSRCPTDRFHASMHPT